MKTARVFKTGRSTAVCIPKEWLGNAEEVLLRREGCDIMITPRRKTLSEIALKFRGAPLEIERLPQKNTPHDIWFRPTR